MIIFTFEEKEFLKDIFKIYDRKNLINNIRKMEVDENNYNELNDFKNNLLYKIENCSEKDLENLFLEI